MLSLSIPQKCKLKCRRKQTLINWSLRVLSKKGLDERVITPLKNRGSLRQGDLPSMHLLPSSAPAPIPT